MSALSRLFSLFGSLDPRSDTGALAPSRAHDALVLLGALAKADGVLGPGERQALTEATSAHLAAGADPLGFLDDPDHEGLDDVASRIRRTWTGAERSMLLDKAMAVAVADGSLGEIEDAILARLARLLDVEMPGTATEFFRPGPKVT